MTTIPGRAACKTKKIPLQACRGIFLFLIPGLQVLQLVIQPQIAGVAAAGDLPLMDGLQHGAALLLGVAAPHKAAAAYIRDKLREGLRQVLLQLQVQLLGIKGRKARSVDDIGVLPQGKQLHMAGGVPSPAQGLADLPHRQGKTGVQGVENAGLPHTGVAGEGAELPRQLPAQLVDPLAGDSADPQHPDGGAAVYPVQLLRRVQVALVQAQQHPAVLQGGNGADAVDEIRIRHRQGGGGDDHQLVDVGRRRAKSLLGV